MRGLIGIRGIVTILILGAIGYFFFTKIIVNKPSQQIMSLIITSPAFKMNGEIPARFTCDGENISPELILSNIPEGTQSLALTMEDPDVPKSIRVDGMWNHWVVWNMPPTTTLISEGAVPQGVTGANTSGKNAYMGPCPPDREHRYIFTLYALDTNLDIPKGSSKEDLLSVIKSHIIEQSQLIGRYNRK